MSKRYMDFVPATAKRETSVKTEVLPKKEAVVKAGVVARKEVTPKVVAKKEVEKKVKKPELLIAQKNSSNEPKLGVIEDWGLRELKAPGSQLKESKREVEAIKAKKVGIKEEKVVPEKKDEKKKKEEEKKRVFEVPKTPFINQDKVEKRPLSKNYYQKKVEVPKEEPKGPVTIITKPEKEANVSLIVTIIITIILGAAAGTVAFLLFPK